MAGLAGNAADSQATGRQRGSSGSEGGGPDERRRGQVFTAEKTGWTGRQQGQDESDESDENADSFRARGAMGGPDDFLSELSKFRIDCKSVVFRLSLRGTLGSAASSTSVFPLPPTQNRV